MSLDVKTVSRELAEALARELLGPLAGMPPLMTVEQAAKVANCSSRAYYEWAIRGQAPSIQVGHRRFVPKAMLMQWLGIPVGEVADDSAPTEVAG